MHLSRGFVSSTALAFVLLGSVYPVSAAVASRDSASPSAGASAKSVPQCSTSDLRVSRSEGEGAAGSTFIRLFLRNKTAHKCRTGGYGGVSYVGNGNGTQIGAPADRVHQNRVKTITLKPGHRAVATLQEVEALNFSKSKCRPRHTDGLRIYPPNQTVSAFVKQKTIGCKNHKVHLLSLSPYHHPH
jgi:Protein of unknown function (DUF4232)